MFATVQEFWAWRPSALDGAGRAGVGGDLKGRGARPSREGKDAGASRRRAAPLRWPGRGRVQRRRPRRPLPPHFPPTISASPKVSERIANTLTSDVTGPHKPGVLPSFQPASPHPALCSLPWPAPGQVPPSTPAEAPLRTSEEPPLAPAPTNSRATTSNTAAPEPSGKGKEPPTQGLDDAPAPRKPTSSHCDHHRSSVPGLQTDIQFLPASTGRGSVFPLTNESRLASL